MTGRKKTNTTKKTPSTAEKSSKKASTSKAKKIVKPKSKVKASAKPKKVTGKPSAAAAITPKAKAKKKSAPVKTASKVSVAPIKIIPRTNKHTPAVFKLPSKKQTPIVFSLEDVREVLKKNKEAESIRDKSGEKIEAHKPKRTASTQDPKKAANTAEPKPEKHRVLGAASVADILGFNPKKQQTRRDDEVKKVPKKFVKFYKNLVDLREHVLSGLSLHSKDTLKRSVKEDSGDLSLSSDAGTDNFERDFALNLLSSEQEALFEIEEAIKRIFDGTYGICLITGKPIGRERLEAVPFTRYSLEGQAQKEKSGRKQAPRRGIFIDSSVEAMAEFAKGDSED